MGDGGSGGNRGGDGPNGGVEAYMERQIARLFSIPGPVLRGHDRTPRERLFDGCGAVTVRHSKDPTGPRLAFTAAEWAAFTAGVRAGEFDR